VAILHQHMTRIAELRLFAFSLAGQQPFRVGNLIANLASSQHPLF
jgi:hypothetical protein